MEEIIATITQERRRFENSRGDVAIFAAESPDGKQLTLKGGVNEAGPLVGGCYRFYGHWTNYNNRYLGIVERQFAYVSQVPTTPAGERGIIRYLSLAKGLGETLARRCWEAFGPEAVEVLRNEPGRAAQEVLRLTPEVAGRVSKWLNERQRLERCTIDVMELIDGHGFPKKTTERAIKAWGNAAAEVIRRSPHSLQRFPGCGFKLCDALYLRLGLPANAIKRQALCAWYAAATQNDGNTWMYVDRIAMELRSSVSGAEVDFQKALRLAVRARGLAVRYTQGEDGPLDDDGNYMWIADGRRARNETRIAKLVAEAMRDHRKKQQGDSESQDRQREAIEPLTDHQREAMIKAIGQGCIGILAGSPGTGKTFTAAAAIKCAVAAYGRQAVAACAPTGKAAVRLSESLQAAGVKLRARTIHSLLGVDQADGEGGGWSFVHNATNPLHSALVVVDESSMIDVDLMASLLAARARGCLMLFIGDVNQLAPVGHGAPLRDMIEAGVPCGELREIRRNSGAIVEACAAMRDGLEFVAGEYTK
jgi:exodeoxyribonuclease V alpha subunit